MASSQNMDLVEITGFYLCPGYFKEKQFLSIDEIYQALEKRDLNESGKMMKWIIDRTKMDICLLLQPMFIVPHLQHVTTRDCMEKILRSQSFIGRSISPRRADFKDLSFWAADIPSNDIERTREEVYAYVQERILPYEAGDYREEIREQFANSPAFNNSASRYGNFRFSFPFSYLLSRYGDQFCDGGKPQLSILGTDTFKLEIIHYMVVHSPDADRFKDLPKVHVLQSGCGQIPRIFLAGDTLYWRPESTTDVRNVNTGERNVQKFGSQEPIENKFCVWNYLTFAFHIPGGEGLHVPREMLIDNLSACGILRPFLKPKDQGMEKTKAEEHIKRVKQQYKGEEAGDCDQEMC